MGRDGSNYLNPLVCASQCRSLLPIRDRPMLWYSLQSVARELAQSGNDHCPKLFDQFFGVAEILLACPKCHVSAVEQFLESFKSEIEGFSPKIKIVESDGDFEQLSSVGALIALKPHFTVTGNVRLGQLVLRRVTW